MNRHAFRSALRMARREALRHKWRSLLVVALIGFPVFVLGCADIAYRSWQLDPTERITREIGAADASVMSAGCENVEQVPQAWLGDGYRCGETTSVSGASPTEATLRGLLPSGTRFIQRLTDDSGIRVKTKAGVKYTSLIGFNYADPMVHGMVNQLHGRAPSNANEVALTTSLAKSVGLSIGGTMQLVNPDRTLTVVGIVGDARYRKIQSAYTTPSFFTQSGRADSALNTTWFIDTPTPVTWDQVRTLNEHSFVALSHSVYLNPPPKSQVPYYNTRDGQTQVGAQVIAVVTLIGGMALLEVVLLAGPAFAVGARRQRRELALVAAVGGQNRDLRNVVLANGVVLGVIAGVSAALGAVLAGFIGIPTLGTLVDQIPGHTDVRPLELAGIATVSLLTALLAALFPALQASRTDVIAALAGRRGTVRTRPHIPVLGAIVAGLGVAVAIFGVTRRNSATTILAGVVLVELGIIMCTPTLLGFAARLGRFLPLAPRIALRDAGRNRSAATPAVAAVMASMIGAVGIAIAVTSSMDFDKRTYTPFLPNGDVFANAAFADGSTPANIASATPEQVRAILTSSLPVDKVTVISQPAYDSDCFKPTATKAICRGDGLIVVRPMEAKSRFQGGAFPPILVDDGSGVDVLFGKPEPAAAAALRAGHAVVVDSSALVDGKVTLGMLDGSAVDPVERNGMPPIIGDPIVLPAVVVSDGFAPARVIVPPSALAQFGAPSPVGVLASLTRQPTDREMQVARGRLNDLDPNAFLQHETGFHNPSQWALYALIGVAALIALGAASIATALANTDGREDLITLGAVGASPRTRRLMSMSRAGVVAGLGCLIGVVAGFVPAYAWTRGTRESYSGIGELRNIGMHFVVPWQPILLALFGIPLVAALLAGLLTRSRLPSERAST